LVVWLVSAQDGYLLLKRTVPLCLPRVGPPGLFGCLVS